MLCSENMKNTINQSVLRYCIDLCIVYKQGIVIEFLDCKMQHIK